MNFQEFNKSYWNYYLELEDRMEETHRFVEYDEDNFKTYSSNYLMLFQAVCSEIDVAGKEIASYFSASFEGEDGTKPINRWWYEIQDNLQNVCRPVRFADSYVLNPWENYRVIKTVTPQTRSGKQVDVTNYNLQPKTDGVTFATPKWWNAYNKVKHKRLKTDDDGVNYKKANLLNISYAFAALYLLEFEFMARIGSLEERVECGHSRLFGMGDLDEAYIDNLFLQPVSK